MYGKKMSIHMSSTGTDQNKVIGRIYFSEKADKIENYEKTVFTSSFAVTNNFI